jgi:HPt (histidine-containing phosphotransfer) domain-containing protein
MAIDPRPYPVQAKREIKRETDEKCKREASDPPNRAQEGPSQVFDRQELVRRCGGDVGLAAHIAAKFRLRSEQDLKDLDAIVDSGAADRIVETAHRLKGVAASMAAHRLAECYKTLEAKAREEDLSDSPELVKRIRMETEALNQTLSNTMTELALP